MSNQNPKNTTLAPGQEPPWYRQFWPWFIIALPASAVIASFYTLWLAVSNPDYMVVDDQAYERLNSDLKAQLPESDIKETGTDGSEPPSG